VPRVYANPVCTARHYTEHICSQRRPPPGIRIAHTQFGDQTRCAARLGRGITVPTESGLPGYLSLRRQIVSVREMISSEAAELGCAGVRRSPRARELCVLHLHPSPTGSRPTGTPIRRAVAYPCCRFLHRRTPVIQPCDMLCDEHIDKTASF